MSNKYTKISAFKNHEENPFLENVVNDIKIVKRTQTIRPKGGSGEIQMIVNNAGEVTGYSAFVRFMEVDEEKFAKLYLSQLSAFWELPKPAIRVFTYILTILIPGRDEFYFFLEDCLKYTNYKSERSVLEGLAELIKAGIIARGKDSIRYFINPLVVFNGDRVTFAQTYIKKKKKVDKNGNEQENNLLLGKFF